MTRVSVLAPAKVNLSLHVTGQRADGYHLLDTLVAFAPFGDSVGLTAAEELTLAVDGPEAAGVPTDRSNLVMRAASALCAAMGAPEQGALHLTKCLPPASGIGGGSSDAAAALRAMMALHGWRAEVGLDGVLDLGDGKCLNLAALGADVPMCFDAGPSRVRGIGEDVAAASLPALPALLVNPRVEVSTPQIFKALTTKDNPSMPADIPAFEGVAECIDWLASQRNDLEAPARALAPEIGEVLAALQALDGCRLARMSGSGATCFALFETLPEAEAALAVIQSSHPEWWAAAGALGDQRAAVLPLES